MAALVQAQGIDASHERLAVLILAREVLANDVVGDRQEAPVLALGALDFRLLADAADPLVRACRRVARLAGLATLEAARVDVFAAAKQRAEEANLDLGRRLLVNDDGSCAVRGHGTPAAFYAPTSMAGATRSVCAMLNLPCAGKTSEHRRR